MSKIVLGISKLHFIGLDNHQQYFCQNGTKASFAIAFGGFAQSGLGREGGLKGLLPYLEPKTVMLNERPKEICS